jgi:hypothetical protein
MPSEGRGILSPILGLPQATWRGKPVDFTGSASTPNTPDLPVVGHTFGHTKRHPRPNHGLRVTYSLRTLSPSLAGHQRRWS